MTDIRSHTEVLGELIDVDGLTVVDVGSGTGELVRWLRSQGAGATGVECGEMARRFAIEADPDHSDDYLHGYGQDLPLIDDSADLVVFAYSLHHVPETEMRAALRESRRVMRLGGTLYVLEPRPEGPAFETARRLEDETRVRRRAQEALGEASSIGFELRAELEYDSQSTYADFESWMAYMVAVDPSRAVPAERLGDELREAFLANSTRMDGGFVLRQPNIVKVYTAV